MPASTTYTSQELCTSQDGRKIYGQLFLPTQPSTEGPLPTVVCAHGFGANYLSLVPFVWELAARGFAVYCFDFCGGGYAARSEGNPMQMTLLTEQDDLLAVIRMLAEHPFVDETCMYLLAEDQGALVGTLLCGTYPHAFASLVLLHPTYNLHDSFRKLFPTKKNIPMSFRQLGMRVCRAYAEHAWDTNPYEYMSAYPGQVLIVHGDEDTTVPLDYARRATAAFPHARVHIIHGGKHVFRGEAQRQCTDAVVEFLVSRASYQRIHP